MNKPTFNSARLRAAALALCLAQTFLAPVAAVAASEPPIKLMSLRGAEINASDPEGDGTRYGLIPHTIKGYTVTKNFNKCMDCHAWARAKETGATKISVTHFKTRDGEELSSVSPRRYFCNQCHVPQSDAKPLVGNTFKPGTGMR